ncbi:ribonuclease H-like domain-containing protein, partial [Tanacetum coccineum]
MIWSKEAREKLDKEPDLYLDAALFPLQFQPTDVLTVASDNIRAVIKDLTAIMLSKMADKQQQQKDDVSLIINESRLKVVNQLQYMCDNSASDNKAFEDFLVHFKSKLQGHLYAEKDDTVFPVGFMERFILTKEATEKERILIDTYRNITNGYHDLYNIYGWQEEEKWYHLDMSLMVKEYKSKVEKELKEICDKVYDPTIKEAFSRHLTDVTTDTIPAQLNTPINSHHDDDINDSVSKISKLDISDPLHLYPNDTTALT